MSEVLEYVVAVAYCALGFYVAHKNEDYPKLGIDWEAPLLFLIGSTKLLGLMTISHPGLFLVGPHP